MLNFILALFLGWPVILITLILATVGLIRRDFRFLVVSAFLSFPYSLALGGFPSVSFPAFCNSFLPALLRMGADVNTDDPAVLDEAKQMLLDGVHAMNWKFDHVDYNELNNQFAIHHTWGAQLTYYIYYLPEGVTIDKFTYRAETDKGVVTETGSKWSKSYRIEHVLGGKNVFYFLTPLDRGWLQVLPVAYDVRRQEWFDTTASAMRHFGDRRDEALYWKERPLTFNTSCFSCHGPKGEGAARSGGDHRHLVVSRAVEVRSRGRWSGAASAVSDLTTLLGPAPRADPCLAPRTDSAGAIQTERTERLSALSPTTPLC